MTNGCFSTRGTPRENTTACDFYDSTGPYLAALGIPDRDRDRHAWGG